MPEIEVCEYHWTMRCHVEDFRQKTFLEGNDALPVSKFDPDTLNGKTWYIIINDEIASLAVLENDHYATKDDKVLRACRFHTLKKYRNLALGSKYILPEMIRWAKKEDYNCVYWTQDIKNKSLNALYQQRRKPLGKTLDTNETWKSIQLDHRWLFQVDKKSDLLQYVYYIALKDKNYKLNPVDCVVWNDNGNKT